ncbi:Uncharacterised protein [uncultured archaeon]|nr:Uncharacterised protein [uncultured archaeon]
MNPIIDRINFNSWRCKHLRMHLQINLCAPPRQTHRPPLLPHFGHLPLLDGQHLSGAASAYTCAALSRPCAHLCCAPAASVQPLAPVQNEKAARDFTDAPQINLMLFIIFWWRSHSITMLGRRQEQRLDAICECSVH